MATPSCSDRAGSCSWAIELGRNARCQLPGPYESRPFLARCGSYDAVVSSSSDDFWAVLYDPNTSRPVGAFQQGPLQACAWYDGSDQGSPYGLTCVALDGECPSNQVADASVPVSVDAGTDGSTPLGVDAGTDGSIPLDAMTPADKCAGAMHVALGGSLSGNTCGGVPTTAAFCGGTVAVYVYIDAPDGVAPKINLSPGAEINAFPTCISDHSFECAGWQGTYVPSDARYRLFSITRIDAECGDFTLQTAAP